MPEPNPYEPPETNTPDPHGAGGKANILLWIVLVLLSIPASVIAFIVTCYSVAVPIRNVEIGVTAGWIAVGVVLLSLVAFGVNRSTKEK